MTNKLKYIIGLKKYIYKKVKAGQDNYREQYIELFRSVKKVTRTAKKQYEIKVAIQVKTDPKGFFQVYRIKSMELVSPLKLGQEEMVSSGEDMGKVFNECFLSAFAKKDKNFHPVCRQIFRGEESEKLIDVKVTKELVVREIYKMKFKSPGPDGVYPRVIKKCKEVVSQPLVNIFRKSVDLKEVPSMWRQANVVPILRREIEH